MITINLLPKERRKATANWLFNLSVITVTVVLIGVAVAAAAAVNLYAVGLQAKLNQVETQLEERSEVLDLVAQLEEHKKLVDEKNKIIDTLVYGRIAWGKKLHDLAQLLPRKVWLERVQLETKITKEKVEPPPQTSTTSSRRRPSRPQFREIRTDYLHIYAVTHNLDEKVAIQGEFEANMRNNPEFFEDFLSVDFQEGQQQTWIERDEESPQVWRFRLTLMVNRKEGSGGTRTDEAS